MLYYLQDIKNAYSDINGEGDKQMEFVVEKTIDNLGRIVLPKSMREYYGIALNSKLIMIPTEDGILIKKLESPLHDKNSSKSGESGACW